MFKFIFRLLYLVKDFLLIIILAVINGIIGNLFSISISIFASITLIKILGYQVALSYYALFSIIILLGVLRGVLRYFEQYSNHFIAFKILAKIRHIMFEKIRSLSPSLLDGKDKGNLITQITSDVETLEVFYAHTISPIMIALFVNGIIVIFLSVYVHYLVGLVALLFYLIVGVIIPFTFYHFNKKTGTIYRKNLSEFSSFYLDVLKGNKDIVYNDKENLFLNETKVKTESLQLQAEKNNLNLSKVKGIIDIVIILSGVSIILINVLLIKMQIINPLLLIVSLITVLSSYGPLVSLSALPSNLNQTFASASRLFKLLDEEVKVKENEEGKDIEFSSLKVEQLSFAYEDKLVLKNINFSMNFDEVIALNGPSGEGKSTLIKLLMNFYKYEGNIYYDDVSLQDINIHALKRQVSMFSQNTYLFNDTIRNNLKIAKKDASDEEIIMALKKASIYDFVMNLENKLDTVIKEDSDNISLGEKQRLGLARVFLRKPKLLLLDEPTSNIDAINEGIILNALKREKDNMGIIIISHKESTLKFADRIYDLKGGILYERS